MSDRPRPSGAGPEELEPEPAPADEAPLEGEPAVPPARVEPVVVPRWVQLVALPLAILGLWALLRAAGPVLLVFLVAAVIALILNPLVKLIQRRVRLPRGLAIAAVYVGFFAAVVGLVAVLIDPVSNQVEAFQKDVPGLIDSANASLANFQSWLDDRGIGVEIKAQGETALETLRDNVLQGSGDLLSFTQDLLRRIVEAGFALVLVIVISVYMLLYGDRIGGVARAGVPPGDGTPEDDFPIRVQKAVSGYVRGQLLFSLIMGTSAGVALWIVGAIGLFPDGKTYALFFGAFFGLMELVPYVGPVLGAIPPILVALLQDPLTAVWVALLFLALQQLEGHVVAPQVFGHTLRINPLLVIFALLIGGQLYGIVGAFVALPLAAVARETSIYLRRHLVLEPWGTPSAAQIEADRLAPRPARCPDCGEAAEDNAAYCSSCGTALRPPVETHG